MKHRVGHFTSEGRLLLLLNRMNKKKTLAYYFHIQQTLATLAFIWHRVSSHTTNVRQVFSLVLAPFGLLQLSNQGFG